MTALVLAAAFVTAAGCGSTVVTSSACSADEPVAGATCATPGESCDRQEGPCRVAFTCGEAGTWQPGATTCTPAAVDCWAASDGDVCATPGETCGEGGYCGGFESTCGDDHLWHTAHFEGDECCYDGCWECFEYEVCPAAPPIEGAACVPGCPGTTSCSYPSDCGAVDATCGDDGTWHLAFSDCAPPPSDPCTLIGSPMDCEASGCRWLVPGCGVPALPEAGCYAAKDCTPADCEAPFSSCQEVSYDPCHGKSCGACGASAFLCLP